MARMIPSQFDQSTVSAAERRLFDLLKNDPGASDWTVLHSLGLSRRGSKPYGEIDYVVIIPKGGIYCLEVKGGRVCCEGGIWETTNRNGHTDQLSRSPFLQAREGMFALRGAIKTASPPGLFDALTFGYAVVLPDVSFQVKSPEWEDCEVIDRDSLSTSISKAILRLVTARRKQHQSVAPSEPDAQKIAALINILRPDFELVVMRATRIGNSEEQLLKLTEEQFTIIDAQSKNERCLFEGAAGTGKTMLALELARRMAGSGMRTLLVCYNRLLGDWFQRQVKHSSSKGLTSGSYFKLLRDVITRSSLADEFQREEAKGLNSKLFEQVYPDCGELAIEELNEPYDIIILDEAQDLISHSVLDVLSLWVKGGLTTGRWAFFGDFHRQAIFNKVTSEEMLRLLTKSTPHFARCCLSLNCRNTRNIGEETSLLSGFASPPYRMGQIEGLPVDYRYYKTPDGQKMLLIAVLKKLLDDGVSASDIIVLSQYTFINSGAFGIEDGHGFKLNEIDAPNLGHARVPRIQFATAQAFKGMESPVVVLCDITHSVESEPQSLLYIAMSRARSQLTLLVHEQAKSAIMERVRHKLHEQWKVTP